MAISDKHKDRYIFHFTDMSNLDSIIKNGLLSTESVFRSVEQPKTIRNIQA